MARQVIGVTALCLCTAAELFKADCKCGSPLSVAVYLIQVNAVYAKTSTELRNINRLPRQMMHTLNYVEILKRVQLELLARTC